MKCIKPGCTSEALSGSNYCDGHQPRESESETFRWKKGDLDEREKKDKDRGSWQRGG
jgi:hypothetical protein